MANSKIPSVQITDTFNTQRGRFNQLVDSVGDVSTLTTTATDITNAIKEHDAELGTISAGAMGTTASTVSTAIAELDGRLDSINTVELLSPRMSLTDGSAINTIAGKLEVSDSADFADNLSVQGNLAVGGNTTMSGTLTVDGEVTFKAGTNSNINLGDANTDNVVFNADVNSNIIPNTDDAYDLGSSTQEWRHVYVDGTVNADNVAADSATIGTLTVTGDTTLNNTITVQDSAYITGDLDLGSNLDVAGNVNVIGTVVSEGALTVEDSAYITGNLDVGGDATFASRVTFNDTITVQDSAYITGNLDIGGDVTSIGTAFTIDAETGTDNVSLGDTITFEAGEGINTTVSNNNIKIDGELATSSNKGVASFSTDNFLVSSGVVTIKDNGVALGTETTGNYMSGISGTANEITVSHTPGEGSSATISLPDDVTIGQDLGVTRNLNVGGLATLDSVNVTGLLAVTGDLTVSNDFTVSGDFVVQGETRNASSYFLVNDGVAVANGNRAGLAVDRPSNDSAVIQWNELGDYWEAGLTTSLNRLALQNDSATFTNIYQTGTGATRLPAGTTGQRPTARQGQVRYNTDLSAFEGYSGTNWGSLGGLIDVDQDTYIVAERVASSDSDTLQFYAAGTKVATLNTSSFDIEEPINVNDTTQATGTTSGALIVDGGVGIAKNAHVGGTLTVTGNTTFNNDVLFDGATNGYNIEWDKSDHSLTFLTGTSLKMGNGDDMSLSVNGSSDTILGTGNNTFYLRSADMRLQSNSNEDYVRGQANGAVTLYHNALNKLVTTVYGVDVNGLMEADSAVISGDISIGGNLTVSGTTTTINTETLTLQDNIIILNSNSAATPTEDAGLEVERGNSDNVVLKWDEGTDRWRFTNDGSTYYNIPISTEYNNYSLPLATNTVRGGIELFSNTDQAEGAQTVTSTAGRTYGIQLNQYNQAVVNVPWSDTNTVYTAGKDIDKNSDTFDIENTLNHVNNITTANNTNFTLTTTGLGDIYLVSSNDNVYMRGTTSAEQIRFELGTGTQEILSSDDLRIEGNNVISLTAGALGSYAATGTPGYYGRIELEAADNRDAILFGVDGYAFDKPHQYMVGVGDLTITTLYSNPNDGIAGISKPVSPSTRDENINIVANAALFLKADSAEVNVNSTITFNDRTYGDSENITFLMKNNLNGGSVIKSGNLHLASTNSTQYYQASSEGGCSFAGTHKFQTGNCLNASLNIICDAPNNLTTLNANNALKLTSSSSSEIEIASASNLDLIATTDIYLKPTGDNVFMQGNTSGEQLNFTLGSSFQYITASDTLVFEAAGDIFLKPTGDDIFMQGTSSSEQIKFTLGTTAQQIVASDDLIIGGGGEMTLYTTGSGDIDLNPFTGKIGLFDNGTEHAGFDVSTSNTLKIYTGSNFGTLNSTFTSNELRVQGDITAFYSSDRTLKENIVEIDNALDKILAIRGVYFDWTDEHIESRGGEDGYFVQKHDVGVIAQEVEEVLPEVVKDREDGTKAVDYHKMIALLIEGMKEQQVQIDDLKTEIRLMKE